jgi:hypothetical protein
MIRSSDDLTEAQLISSPFQQNCDGTIVG